MTGPKTNERPGTRASVQHVRASAYKAREVLDEIRGLHVADAADYLDLCERGIAEPIGKLLDSAIANAEHNDLQDADELFVSACYADEGPTMKRWRPRARGRATRIRKRTCHITLIVSRMDDDRLEVRRNRAERRAAGASAPKADRSARVAKSKAAAEPTETSADEEVEELIEDNAAGDDSAPITDAGVDDASASEEEE
ncbi:MAG: 50S ribosomal protein L22 [Acidimicrobiia bacterium]|nr:50S ribosomal protein L22 [Acidimicrobiia bacterium]